MIVLDKDTAQQFSDAVSAAFTGHRIEVREWSHTHGVCSVHREKYLRHCVGGGWKTGERGCCAVGDGVLYFYDGGCVNPLNFNRDAAAFDEDNSHLCAMVQAPSGTVWFREWWIAKD